MHNDRNEKVQESNLFNGFCQSLKYNNLTVGLILTLVSIGVMQVVFEYIENCRFRFFEKTPNQKTAKCGGCIVLLPSPPPPKIYI